VRCSVLGQRTLPPGLRVHASCVCGRLWAAIRVQGGEACMASCGRSHLGSSRPLPCTADVKELSDASPKVTKNVSKGQAAVHKITHTHTHTHTNTHTHTCTLMHTHAYTHAQATHPVYGAINELLHHGCVLQRDRGRGRPLHEGGTAGSVCGPSKGGWRRGGRSGADAIPP
jgi:hypothetical protein